MTQLRISNKSFLGAFLPLLALVMLSWTHSEMEIYIQDFFFFFLLGSALGLFTYKEVPEKGIHSGRSWREECIVGELCCSCSEGLRRSHGELWSWGSCQSWPNLGKGTSCWMQRWGLGQGSLLLLRAIPRDRPNSEISEASSPGIWGSASILEGRLGSIPQYPLQHIIELLNVSFDGNETR